jgi:RecA-family ATPase
MSVHPWQPPERQQSQPERNQPRPATADDGFRPFTPGRWQGLALPQRDWLVKDLISAGTVTMLSGDGGLGKSLLLQQLLTAAALGKDWLGFETKRVRTWGMFCEDAERELHIRQHWICRHYGCEMSDLDEDMTIDLGMDRTSYLCHFPKFEDEPKPTALYDRVMRHVEHTGAQLIGFDTARKTFGGNEIRDRQIAGYVRMLRRIALQTQGAVIVTAHPSNEGVASGSGLAGNRAWRNEIRSMIYLTGSKDHPDARILKTMKNNYGRSGGKLDLQYRSGVFVTTTEIEPEPKNWYEKDLLDDWPAHVGDLPGP